ncbi:hypothetical protein [Aquicoccus porphyridii]|uniref:Uncharacterized protein n=1 Tax=Aquicoccus porphyridii TaxID=1852029 RepID=A0A5A9ZSX6_9RHOB|nr:hypothetical protein [Aquicoccus porphyridii]KAA0920259.1 hypothetical protein FLO80_03850 [Aquicoccus porphyridii]
MTMDEKAIRLAGIGQGWGLSRGVSLIIAQKSGKPLENRWDFICGDVAALADETKGGHTDDCV